jgi:hypothetical protein
LKYEARAQERAVEPLEKKNFIAKGVDCIDRTWAESRPMPDIITDLFVVLFGLFREHILRVEVPGSASYSS